MGRFDSELHEYFYKYLTNKLYDESRASRSRDRREYFRKYITENRDRINELSRIAQARRRRKNPEKVRASERRADKKRVGNPRRKALRRNLHFKSKYGSLWEGAEALADFKKELSKINKDSQ